MAYGGFGMHTSVVSEKEVSIEDIVAEANEIWKELKSRKLDREDYVAGEQFYNEMCKKHPEFSKSYALVLRYIAEMRIYSAKVFMKWLKQIQVRPWKSAEEYFESQSNYVMLLHTHYNPRASAEERYAVRNNVRKLLTDEYEDFKKTTQKYEKAVNERDAKLAAKNKADLLNYLVNAPADELAQACTIRVEVDNNIADCPTNNTRPVQYSENTESLTCMSADDILA